ncbi:MAG: FAD-dependent oxidoreductase, partial [Balneolaceae bacterium]|nr:FAD-dependent oxidoreductase [Balneolaceae bacterium]
MPDLPRRHLLIAGGGHASLPLIKMGWHWKRKNLFITLVSAEDYLVYSGALPQFMGGFYTWQETAINLRQLCQRYGVQFIRARAGGIDNHKQTIRLDDGRELSFDYSVINVGARTSDRPSGSNIHPVKPMSALLPLKEKLESGHCRRLLILGGGAAGTELALNLSHPECTYSPDITLIEKREKLLDGFPRKASETARQILETRGVSILTGESSSADDFDSFDDVILATGNEPESVNIEHSFPTGSENRILTDKTLLISGESCIFAAGDTADVDGKGYEQIGVHAVKQGKTLRVNIQNLLENKSLEAFTPYPVNPLIISDGPDRALFTAADLCLTGRSAAILKYLLDMRWLEKYTKKPDSRRS